MATFTQHVANRVASTLLGNDIQIATANEFVSDFTRLNEDSLAKRMNRARKNVLARGKGLVKQVKGAVIQDIRFETTYSKLGQERWFEVVCYVYYI